MMDNLLLDEKSLEACRKKIEKGIRDKVEQSGASGVVLGLSGGVDSSLVLKLAASSGVDVCALIMPEESMTPKEDVDDAVALAKADGVRCIIIKIDPVMDALKKTFPWEGFREKNRIVSLGNAKARVRMILNYLASNLDERIVLGTGNRTEILLGYSTKYGDGGVDFQPIGGLYKTQVRQLASHVGVPEGIIRKVPTAGLWRGQTDEGEIGASYEDIDGILFCLVDERRSVSETIKALKKDPCIVTKIADMVEGNRHKREMPQSIDLVDELKG